MNSTLAGRASGLHVVRAAGAGALAAELVRRWAEPAGDPFVGDLIVVPGAGMRRWVGQQIAVAAGV